MLRCVVLKYLGKKATDIESGRIFAEYVLRPTKKDWEGGKKGKEFEVMEKSKIIYEIQAVGNTYSIVEEEKAKSNSYISVENATYVGISLLDDKSEKFHTFMFVMSTFWINVQKHRGICKEKASDRNESFQPINSLDYSPLISCPSTNLVPIRNIFLPDTVVGKAKENQG